MVPCCQPFKFSVLLLIPSHTSSSESTCPGTIVQSFRTTQHKLSFVGSTSATYSSQVTTLKSSLHVEKSDGTSKVKFHVGPVFSMATKGCETVGPPFTL